MAAKFEIKKSKKGQFYFTLKAPNGKIILQSEMYKTKDGAKNGISSVRKNAKSDKRFERKSSSKEEPFFVLKAPNGEIIGQSEMYSSASSMNKGIQSVAINAPKAVEKDRTV